jgi:hypothetical protein
MICAVADFSTRRTAKPATHLVENAATLRPLYSCHFVFASVIQQTAMIDHLVIQSSSGGRFLNFRFKFDQSSSPTIIPVTVQMRTSSQDVVPGECIQLNLKQTTWISLTRP